MTGLVSAGPHNNSMIDIFAPRFKVATRAIGMTDVLSPHQVRTFSDCEVRWFYEHLLGLPDPPTAKLALDKAVRAALMINDTSSIRKRISRPKVWSGCSGPCG